MIAVEASHGVPARNVIAADGVEGDLGQSVLIIVDIRAVLVEVDRHVGIEGLDRRPGVRADLVIAEAVKVEKINFREPRRVGGDERGASAVVEKERLQEFARGGLRRERESRAQKKREGRSAQRSSGARATGGN